MLTGTEVSTHSLWPFPCGMEYTQDFNGTTTNPIRQDIRETGHNKFTRPRNTARSPHVRLIRE